MARLVDNISEHHGGNDRRQSRTGVHHAAGGAGVFGGNVHRDCPHRPDRKLGAKEASAERKRNQPNIVGKENGSQGKAA